VIGNFSGIISLVVIMSREQSKRGKHEKSSDGAGKVIVAVKASKEIPKSALVWSLTHVVQPGDCITLLVVVPSQSSGHFSIAFFCFFIFILMFWFDICCCMTFLISVFLN